MEVLRVIRRVQDIVWYSLVPSLVQTLDVCLENSLAEIKECVSSEGNS